MKTKEKSCYYVISTISTNGDVLMKLYKLNGAIKPFGNSHNEIKRYGKVVGDVYIDWFDTKEEAEEFINITNIICKE